MSGLVFQAKRNFVEFDFRFTDGQEVTLKWYEPNIELMQKFMKAGSDPDGMVAVVKELLDKSIEADIEETKQKAIAEMLNNMGVQELFEMVEILNNAITDLRKKKPRK